ncbi:hypothetical protein HNR23_003883 [Nocardiopsis mwathae]|uniref:Uncharacterized protein n=1 Tax=Nocardiopsis mwathae TaxID=1472723 RepID=A0A7X0D6X3_9ACTN|nr:hypothetical protein [Nocardiopsis mwathae]MBB6173823.1 hypothetical protein [Nocardiopsis mwathae]
MTSKRRGRNKRTAIRTGPQPTDEHDIVFYRAPDGTMPAQEYLNSVPATIRARIRSAAIAVAQAPPMRFAGGGYWEAMRGSMTGWFEIRVDGPPNRTHYRVFCLLDYEAKGVDKPLLVLVDGRTKAFRTTLPDSDYAAVLLLGKDYFSQQPRPIG